MSLFISTITKTKEGYSRITYCYTSVREKYCERLEPKLSRGCDMGLHVDPDL